MSPVHALDGEHSLNSENSPPKRRHRHNCPKSFSPQEHRPRFIQVAVQVVIPNQQQLAMVVLVVLIVLTVLEGLMWKMPQQALELGLLLLEAKARIFGICTAINHVGALALSPALH
ncbi:uncharacterized protein Z518_10026 [Rhinocladiella mackenziei CBS 650.93]|uniref:Rhinocladiella mackenziei CBS 650.93 unplaced genomic scaffold supercont1.8, whole genome shotgun sequence n=1 Tax=Rhinocladiella mackenziei CBS 650.93 TaxID=1442369 RepID=A0A0D2IWC6_9EURO|nr:uncharacterized protein Z518_10026 [Rhinocladiella mackenziei CBS 650.93]KIX00960.1 hypothetical protein Z518_10026 [Rhinocladiella mackenziei CBS 650.93]